MSTFLKMPTKYVTKRPVTQATVKVKQVSQHFRVIELACPTPFKTAIEVGDKISITLDGKRIATPQIAVEGVTSHIRLCIYMHGSPGSAWASSVLL